MFEITTIAARDTFTLELLGGNNDPLLDTEGKPISVTVYGPGSKAYLQAQSARNQRLMDRMAAKGSIKLSCEEQIVESAEFLADTTICFNGWGYKGANDPAAIRAAYQDTSIGFIVDQISKASNTWANFTSSSCAS